MTLDNLMYLCESYSNLGWSVQEQLRTFVDTGSTEELNPNAVDLFTTWLARAEDAEVEDIYMPDELVHE